MTEDANVFNMKIMIDVLNDNTARLRELEKVVALLSKRVLEDNYKED